MAVGIAGRCWRKTAAKISVTKVKSGAAIMPACREEQRENEGSEKRRGEQLA